MLRFADLELDPAARRAERGGRRLELTKTEFALLELFLRNPRRVLSRDAQIFESVWGYDFGPSSNALWVYVGTCARKLEADGEPRLIQTVRGLGYVLREGPGTRRPSDVRAGGREKKRSRSLSLGVRLTIVSAVAVALAVAVASIGAFVIVRSQLVRQLDQSLLGQLEDIQFHGNSPSGRPRRRSAGRPATSR